MTIEKIDPELCIGCGDCVNSCPMDVIRMEAAGGMAVIRYGEDCMNCQDCGRCSETLDEWDDLCEECRAKAK